MFSRKSMYISTTLNETIMKTKTKELISRLLRNEFDSLDLGDMLDIDKARLIINSAIEIGLSDLGIEMLKDLKDS